jgi:hypothetical protein
MRDSIRSKLQIPHGHISLRCSTLQIYIASSRTTCAGALFTAKYFEPWNPLKHRVTGTINCKMSNAHTQLSVRNGHLFLLGCNRVERKLRDDVMKRSAVLTNLTEAVDGDVLLAISENGFSVWELYDGTRHFAGGEDVRILMNLIAVLAQFAEHHCLPAALGCIGNSQDITNRSTSTLASFDSPRGLLAKVRDL